MIEIPSQIEGKEYDLYDLEKALKPIGYTIGGGWEYDHGFFDYKIDDSNGYQFLRLPFHVVEGQLDVPKCTVAMGRPFLLAHQYEAGLDREVDNGNLSSPFNQFQEPENKDAEVPESYIEIGQKMVAEVENRLLSL